MHKDVFITRFAADDTYQDSLYHVCRAVLFYIAGIPYHFLFRLLQRWTLLTLLPTLLFFVAVSSSVPFSPSTVSERYEKLDQNTYYAMPWRD